jgi:hypothetical protein
MRKYLIYFWLICFFIAALPIFSYDLVIDLADRYRPVSHCASGSLYGLRDEGRPGDSVISPTKPFMFVQPAPHGEHAPYNYPSGTGDVLDNAHIAARNGATVTIRMADTFPTFPYHFTSMQDWENRVNQMITDWLNSGNDNLYGYEIYNEPDYTYDGGPSFNEVWRTAYNIIRSRHPGAKIIGPSTTGYNSFCTNFLNWARSNNCLPDIVCWHELGNAFNLQGNIDRYVNSGIGRPISINEYVSSGEDGQPGKIVDYIATFERNTEVESACLPFWSTCGSMGNILTGTFQPNGAWHVFKWYGDMNGSMVWTQDPASMIDGFSSINNAGDRAYIIFGGANNQRIVVNGISATSLGNRVHVYAEYTEWVGINTVYNNTRFWFEDDYNVTNNQIMINVNNMDEYDAYRITLTPAEGSETPTPTPTGPPPGILGDVNEDNSINIIDALLVAQCYVGLHSCPPATIADTNCDGTIDIIDALLIAQYYVGLISGFCLS